MEKELGVIPMVRLVHNDNWGYEVIGHSDNFVISYMEKEGSNWVVKKTFEIPSFVAVEVLAEALRVAEAIDLEEL